MNQAKREARRRGKTVTALIEQGLKFILAQPEPQQPRKRITLPVADGGGLLPGIDLDKILKDERI